MASDKLHPKPTALIVTEDEVYRLDDILTQITDWNILLSKIRKGRVIPVPYPYGDVLDEYEAHFRDKIQEIKAQTKADLDPF